MRHKGSYSWVSNTRLVGMILTVNFNAITEKNDEKIL